MGLVFSAAGSGVLLVVVLVALAEALVVAEVLAEAVLVAAVAPADGAVWTPAAVGAAAATAGDGGRQRERGAGDGCRLSHGRAEGSERGEEATKDRSLAQRSPPAR